MLCWQETVEYAEPHGATDEELFSTVYHKLVHSPALETMLQVEHSYALAVRELMAQKDEQVTALTQKWVNDIAFSITVNIATMETHFWDSSEFTESNSLPFLTMRLILVLSLNLCDFPECFHLRMVYAFLSISVIKATSQAIQTILMIPLVQVAFVYIRRHVGDWRYSATSS